MSLVPAGPYQPRLINHREARLFFTLLFTNRRSARFFSRHVVIKRNWRHIIRNPIDGGYGHLMSSTIPTGMPYPS
jgi:hypothetical protein